MPASQVQSVYTPAGGGGGGGLTGFTASVNTASPNNITNASRLLVDATTANADAILQPKGTGSILAQLPDSAIAGGNKRGSYCIDLQLERDSADDVAIGSYNAILGGRRNQFGANSEESTIVGGRANGIGVGTAAYLSFIGGGNSNSVNNNAYASAIVAGMGNAINSPYYSIIGAGQSNTITGWHGFIGAGQSNSISGSQYCVIGGGNSNITYSVGNVICGGASNISAGDYSVIIGGTSNSMQGAIYGTILGGYRNYIVNNGAYATVLGVDGHADKNGILVHGGYNMVIRGDNQYERMILCNTTFNATPVELTFGMQTATNATTYSLRNRSAVFVTIRVVARRQSAIPGDQKAWELKLLVENGLGTAAIVGSVTKTVIAASANATTWDVNVAVTNDRIQVLATGDATYIVKFAATIDAVVVNSQT